MISATKLLPFLIYNPSNQGIDLHQISKKLQIKNYHIISVIEVKRKDYKLFAFQKCGFAEGHGLYISEPILDQSTNKQILYLVLPTNQNKIGEKYQDFFASIALMASSVCIFDISSKYVRQSKNFQSSTSRNNYVVMASHSNGAEIYRANIGLHNNKMQISSKLQIIQGVLPQQFTNNLEEMQQIGYFQQTIAQCLQDKSFYKSYLNFDEIQYRVLALLRIFNYLQNKSVQFGQLTQRKLMLSTHQLSILQNQINDFKSNQFNTFEQISVLNSVKLYYIQKLRKNSEERTQSFVFDLKKLYFSNVSSYQQLSIKRQLFQNILQQYGIKNHFSQFLYSQVLSNLQKKQIKQYKQIVDKKDKKIRQLEQNIIEYSKTINKNCQIIKVYQQKNFDFKQLNSRYEQKCNQLQKQRQNSRKLKLQLQNLFLQLQRKQNKQESLHKVIKQAQEWKEKQNSNIISLQEEIIKKQKFINEIEQKMSQFQSKIKNYQNLQSQAWKCIQQTQIARDQLQRYKQLLHKLQDHFDSFKRMQVEKINYILRRNADNFLKLKRQSEQKSIIIDQNRQRIEKLCGQLQEEKARLKFCQQQVWHINSNKKNRQILGLVNKNNEISRKENHEANYKSSFISAI